MSYKSKKVSSQVYAGLNIDLRRSPEKILIIIQLHFDMRPEDFYKKTRKSENVKARQIAIYLLDYFSEGNYTLKELAYLVGYKSKGSHSTALHSIKCVKNNIKLYKSYANMIFDLKLKCQTYLDKLGSNIEPARTIRDLYK